MRVGDALTVAGLSAELAGRGFVRRVPSERIPWPAGSIYLLAVGKAAGSMAEGVRRVLGKRLRQSLVIAPPGAEAPGPRARRVQVLRGEHPVPGPGSFAAGRAALSFVRNAGREDLILFAISGGASALMVSPNDGISEEQFAEVNRRLLRSGASIESMNTVRGALSNIKNGRLARSTPAAWVTLVMSDVGGDIAAVGSGPTLARQQPIDETLLRRVAPGLPIRRPVRRRPHPTVLLADPSHLVAAAASFLAAKGFDIVHAVDRPDSPTVAARVQELARVARGLPARSAWVEACEPVLRVPKSAGEGGRSTHLLTRLASKLSDGTAALAAGSDGVDGTASIAGGAIDHDTDLGFGAPKALKEFNTGPLLRRAAGVTVLAPGPTGVNLRDLHVIIRG